MELSRVRRNLIKNKVKDLLLLNNIKTAPVDVESIAEKLKIKIVKVNADDDEAGFIMKPLGNESAVIGVNKNHGYNRRRFTIAHELGHFFLHDFEDVYFDGKHSGSRMFLRDKKSTDGSHVEEKEANLFAAELLMPEIFLEQDLNKIEEIYLIDEDPSLKQLAKKYRVSIQALTFRLAYLGHFQFQL
jgi:Zn-dependent peptidase ImmA (M78 family)